jgi:hypothetical protein
MRAGQVQRLAEAAGQLLGHALGTIISALISSRPTTRMESTTVAATRAASTTLSASTGRPTARAYSSSSLTAYSRWPEQPHDAEHHDGDDAEDRDVRGGRGGDRAEQVGLEVGRLPARGEAQQHHAAGDAAVEEDGERDVAAGAPRAADRSMSTAPARRRPAPSDRRRGGETRPRRR